MDDLALIRLASLQALFARVHDSNGETDDQEIDDALGLNRRKTENGLRLGALLSKYGNHRMETGDIPYSVVRDVYRALRLPLDTPITDLGSGYGRIGFYGAVLWRQPVYGIEIVPERVNEAQRVQESLGLSSLHFQIGDLLAVPWPRVSHYLVLNSVFPSLMPRVIARLTRIARTRPITIASISTSNQVFHAQPWLQEHIPDTPSAKLPASLRLFTSRAGALGVAE